ncbi:HD domain-containing protein [Patescibacteria group bacterium]|nr:HD domain-containing protein [Patescibacteria group bacterium]MCL5010105.1 HD domain-containing protein [Patescibacteria group bacterium]
MTKGIPQEVLAVYKKLQDEGFDVYFVGGCVRDLLLRRKIKDWDFATNAEPEEILKIFPESFYDNIFGTVGMPIEAGSEKRMIEITTFRSETGYSDRRRPDVIKWGETIEEDLGRRDFTINAIAMNLATGNSEPATNIIDPYNGQKDLGQKLIRAVGDPAQRFKEDALRFLRAIRIATELGFTIEENTLREMRKDAPLLSHVSSERIKEEFLRILASPYPYEGILLLKNVGLLEIIVPELLEGAGVSQVRPGRHHKTDVFNHNLLSLKFCPSKNPIVRFAALIHDIGKPRAAAKDEQGLIIFHNHEIVGARMAEEICKRLRFSNKDRDKIINLIRWHMFTVDEKATDSAVRRFIRRVGTENIKDMLDLRIADRLGSGAKFDSWRFALFRKRVEKQLEPAPFSINDLAVDGHDIMRESGIRPGPRVGKILKLLFEEVDEDLNKNNREYLLKRIKALA